jgi:hypothetical protein
MQKRDRNLAAEEILIEVMVDGENSFSVKQGLNIPTTVH